MASDEMGRMVTCHSVGINGGCGYECPVYLEGDCEEPPEPYVWICMDATGVSLTDGKRYTQVRKDREFLTVVNDDGDEKEFFVSRFDLDEDKLGLAG